MDLDAFVLQQPSLAPQLQELATAYSRRLWHQATLAAAALVASPDAAALDLRSLWTALLVPVAPKLNPLELVRIGIAIAHMLTPVSDALPFLESLLTLAKVPATPEALATVHAARVHALLPALAPAKAALAAARAALDACVGADASVHAGVHAAAAALALAAGDTAAYYTAALQQLGYTPADALPAESARTIAYNLLTHDILGALRGTDKEWALDLLAAFDAGVVSEWNTTLKRHEAAAASEPALVRAAARLEEKVAIMALLRLVAGGGARTLPLRDIAAATAAGDVEFVVMRALALGLVRGHIDEVAGTLTVTWVQPRTLTRADLAPLAERLALWRGEVQQTLTLMEDQLPRDLVA